eukprot:UN01700
MIGYMSFENGFFHILFGDHIKSYFVPVLFRILKILIQMTD